MTVFTETFTLESRGNVDILDISDELQGLVAESGIRDGQLTVMVSHSTAALSTLEYEPGLVGHDIAAALKGIAPEDGHYEHEKTWNDDNGHSHVRATLVGPSLAFPVLDGRIPLGTWQQVVLIDMDTSRRTRTLAVSIIGE